MHRFRVLKRAGSEFVRLKTYAWVQFILLAALQPCGATLQPLQKCRGSSQLS